MSRNDPNYIPKLPGYSTDDPTARRTTHTKTLGFFQGQRYVRASDPADDLLAGEMTKASIGDAQDTWPMAAHMKIPGAEAEANGEFTPSYVALDGKVLRFDAFLKEDTPEIPAEGYRIRKFQIFYFLVDDSIRVSEMRVENSGLAQGTFLKRHRCPRTKAGTGTVAPGSNMGFISWEDFDVGSEIIIYGRPMLLVDCDAFTREFYLAKGREMAPAGEIPNDPYFVRRKAAEEKVPLKVYDDRRQRFLQYNRKVLRFYCQWDDRERLYGERRPFVLHFYLEDDTVEVCEVHLPNDGRDSFPKLLRRQKLPLDTRSALQDIGSAPNSHYTDADFRVGDKINVFGRTFLIYDCDDFTKQHYATKYGISHFPNLTDRIKTPMVDIPQREVPPPTGFGSDEDSLGSIYNLVPKQPKRDEAKLMEFAGKTLRFLAKFDKPRAKEDAERKFIVAFWLADDTVSVFEPPLSNSGIIGGKFLERTEQMNVLTGERFTFTDFVVGDTIVINAFEFRIIDCDKFSQTFIESKGQVIRSQLYSASLVGIMKNLQKRYEEAKEQLRSAFHVMDQDHSGSITHEEFIASLNQLHFDITIEEAEAILWWFDPDFKGYISYAEFCEAIVRSDAFPQFLLNWEKKKRHGTLTPAGRASAMSQHTNASGQTGGSKKG